MRHWSRQPPGKQSKIIGLIINASKKECEKASCSLAQPGVEPGSLTDRVSVLTTTLLNHTGPHLSVSLRSYLAFRLFTSLEWPYRCSSSNKPVVLSVRWLQPQCLSKGVEASMCMRTKNRICTKGSMWWGPQGRCKTAADWWTSLLGSLQE